jgi:type I restriction enzyme S subunit
MTEWNQCKLGDVAEKIAMGPFGSNIKVETFKSHGVPIISGTHLHETRMRDKDFNFISEEHAERLKNSNVYRGDVIFTHAGSIGQVSFIPSNSKYNRYIISQRQFYLRCNKNTLDNEFITYYFKSRYGQFQLLSNANQTGVPSLAQPASFLKELVINLPPLPEQEAIASVLSCLDDKIDLLHRQNKTLEAMAETLFRQWFVEEAVEGWEGRRLENLCTITRGASPRPIIKYVVNGTVPWIKIADGSRSNSFFIDSTNEFIIEEGVRKSVKVFPGDLILSNSATCGFPYFVELEGCIHDGWLLFRDFHGVSKYFVFFFLKQIFRELNSFADGSVQDNLNTGMLKEFPVKVPPASLVRDFDNQISNLVNKIKNNIYQCKTLEKLRDTLLPKLMSGEVRIAETEKVTNEQDH